MSFAGACRKRPYRDELDALAAMAAIRARAGAHRRERRAYACPWCGAWHLTSWTTPAGGLQPVTRCTCCGDELPSGRLDRRTCSDRCRRRAARRRCAEIRDRLDADGAAAGLRGRRPFQP